MNNPESTTPTVNSATTPSLSTQQVQDIQRANKEAYSQANKDLSFLTILASAHLRAEPIASMEAMQDLQDILPAEEKKTPDVAKSDKPKKTSSTAEPDSVSTASTSSKNNVDNEVKDALDMLSVDLSKIPSTDLSVLLRLGQGVPPQVPVMQNLSPSLIEALPNTHYASLGVSKGLQDLLESAYKTQRPVRISLSDNAAMILRLGRDGRVSAEFLPNTQAAEAFFRQNMLELQNRLESKELPYGSLSVRNWQEQQERKQQQQQ